MHLASRIGSLRNFPFAKEWKPFNFHNSDSMAIASIGLVRDDYSNAFRCPMITGSKPEPDMSCHQLSTSS